MRTAILGQDTLKSSIMRMKRDGKCLLGWPAMGQQQEHQWGAPITISGWMGPMGLVTTP